MQPDPTTSIGTVEHGPLAHVDGRGNLALDALPIQLDWWIGADDRWHDARSEVAVRQHTIGDAPAVETRMRVPDGDAVARVYALADADGVIIWEFVNDSPSPFAAALAFRPISRRLPSIDSVNRVLVAAGRPFLEFARAPGAVHLPGTTRDRHSLPEALHDERIGVAVVPVPHRSSTRVAVVPGQHGVVDLASAPDADAVATAWAAQLRRGLQVELPDARWQSAITRARAEMVLQAGGKRPVAPAVIAALEDWGFDAEAAAAWDRLGVLAKRRAAKRVWVDPVDAFTAAERLATAPEAGPLVDPAALLQSVRVLLATDSVSDRSVIELLPFLPDAWRGASLDVRELPTRGAQVSYAVRWHGERAALLWESSARHALRCPGLSADWSSVEPAGEALL